MEPRTIQAQLAERQETLPRAYDNDDGNYHLAGAVMRSAFLLEKPEWFLSPRGRFWGQWTGRSPRVLFEMAVRTPRPIIRSHGAKSQTLPDWCVKRAKAHGGEVTLAMLISDLRHHRRVRASKASAASVSTMLRAALRLRPFSRVAPGRYVYNG